MSPAFGLHSASRATLQRIVPDGGYRPEALVDIPRLEKAGLPIRPVAPDPGEAIRLELEADREPIRLAAGRAGLGLPDSSGSFPTSPAGNTS